MCQLDVVFAYRRSIGTIDRLVLSESGVHAPGCGAITAAALEEYAESKGKYYEGRNTDQSDCYTHMIRFPSIMTIQSHTVVAFVTHWRLSVHELCIDVKILDY